MIKEERIINIIYENIIFFSGIDEDSDKDMIDLLFAINKILKEDRSTEKKQYQLNFKGD